METFSALLALCAGNSPVTGEFPSQRPVMRSFDVFFDLRLNKRLNKHSWGWWFETPSHSSWRHCNDSTKCKHQCIISLLTTHIFASSHVLCNELAKLYWFVDVTQQCTGMSIDPLRNEYIEKFFWCKRLKRAEPFMIWNTWAFLLNSSIVRNHNSWCNYNYFLQQHDYGCYNEDP